MRNWRVLGIGEARIEHLALVDRHPDPGTTLDLAGFSIQGGGTVATALAALANLAVATDFCGKVGDDDFGRFILRSLSGLGVGTEGVVVQPDRVSPYGLVIVERDSARHTVMRTRGSVDLLQLSEMDLKDLAGMDLLLLDGQQPLVQVAAAERARQLGVKVVLDAGGMADPCADLVPLCDVLIATERFTAGVAPHGEVEDSLRDLSQMGPKTVVVTMGREGSLALEGDKLVRQPPLQVDVVDTTGAGDVFLGGYCYGILSASPLETCMRMASIAAGLSCRRVGARAGLPTLEEIEAVM